MRNPKQHQELKLATLFLCIKRRTTKVTARKGAQVTVCPNRHFITRSASYFKQLPADADWHLLDDNESNHCFDFESEPNTVYVQPEPNRYPARVQNPVQRYGHNIFDK